jgi:hypothetical protein
MTSTAEKIRALEAAGSDFEWYPTTDEIINAMQQDILALFRKDIIGTWQDHDNFYSNGYERNSYHIKTFLDVGAGDGRVFNSFKAMKNLSIDDIYGIELAQPFAEDLIQKDDVFLIGRDFFRTSLIDKYYSVIFSNPPYSKYMEWVVRLLQEANFVLMYLVIPVRWEDNQEIMLHLKRYNVETVGEYDFIHGDRPARAHVNLVRIMSRRLNTDNEDRYGRKLVDEDDSFDRWIQENIGSFESNEAETDEQERHLKIKQGTIADMVENYEYEMKSLLDAFKALSKLPSRIFKDLGMNKEKITKQIKENTTKLKNTYWQFAFEKLDAIKRRLTKNTRHQMLSRMQEFSTLDFNEDNIYSIILWVIKKFNKYTAQQILEVFDALTSPECIKAYKSNVHWLKDDWRYAKWDNGKGKPDKYILDYRIVTHCYVGPYDYDRDTIIDDLRVVFESLGYPVPEWERADYSKDGRLQEFTTRFMGPGSDYTEKQETAFTARHYKNNNLHLKINEKIMLRFNVEVARLRHWINGPKDIVSEYDVSEEEAIKMWKEPSLIRIGQSDILQLGFTPSDKMSA